MKLSKKFVISAVALALAAVLLQTNTMTTDMKKKLLQNQL